MEMSSVSPPPTSPTEGDDLCEIDVTNMAIHGVTLLICLCGLFGNGAVLCLLRWKRTVCEILGVAITDCLFLLFTASSALLFLLEDLSCSLIMSPLYLRILFLLSWCSYSLGLFWLTQARFTKDIVELCELLCHCQPRKSLLQVMLLAFRLFVILSILFPMATLLCPLHEQQQCRAALMSMFTVFLLLLVAPVVTSSTIKFIKVKSSSQRQQLKRRDIAVCLAVLFTVVLSLWNFLEHLGYIAVSSQVVLLPACINSTIKPFIYIVVGSCGRPCSVGCLRLSLQAVFGKQKDITARRNDATMDTGSDPVDPFPCTAEGPQNSG